MAIDVMAVTTVRTAVPVAVPVERIKRARIVEGEIQTEVGKLEKPSWRGKQPNAATTASSNCFCGNRVLAVIFCCNLHALTALTLSLPRSCF